MSTKAQAIWEQLESLPPVEQREVWNRLNRRLGGLESEPELEPITDEDIEKAGGVALSLRGKEEKRADGAAQHEVSDKEFQEALDEVTGCTAEGGSLLQRLLEERRRDREREDAWLEEYRRRRARG
jgi:hypothetical protein